MENEEIDYLLAKHQEKWSRINHFYNPKRNPITKLSILEAIYGGLSSLYQVYFTLYLFVTGNPIFGWTYVFALGVYTTFTVLFDGVSLKNETASRKKFLLLMDLLQLGTVVKVCRLYYLQKVLETEDNAKELYDSYLEIFGSTYEKFVSLFKDTPLVFVSIFGSLTSILQHTKPNEIHILHLNITNTELLIVLHITQWILSALQASVSLGSTVIHTEACYSITIEPTINSEVDYSILKNLGIDPLGSKIKYRIAQIWKTLDILQRIVLLCVIVIIVRKIENSISGALFLYLVINSIIVIFFFDVPVKHPFAQLPRLSSPSEDQRGFKIFRTFGFGGVFFGVAAHALWQIVSPAETLPWLFPLLNSRYRVGLMVKWQLESIIIMVVLQVTTITDAQIQLILTYCLAVVYGIQLLFFFVWVFVKRL